MENFNIEKNIPIPEDIRGSSSQRPWHKMEVGDSVFIPLKEDDNAQRAKNISPIGSLYYVIDLKKKLMKTVVFKKYRVSGYGVLLNDIVALHS